MKNMITTRYLTKAPAHTLLSVAAESARRVSPASLNSPTFRHRAVMGLFPAFDDANPRSAAEILFRLETPAGQAPYFLIQSATEPTVSNYPDIVTKQVELQAPPTGTSVSFRISLNAIRRETFTNASGKRSYKVKPIPLDHEDTERTTFGPWLAQKLSPALDAVEVTTHRRAVLKDPKAEKGRMTLQIDAVDGIAVVHDTTALVSILTTGIGREKAYGCGLLSIRALS